jgi:hypothetical protein
MAVIENWVILAPGVERRLRFSDHRIVSKVITDPVLKSPKTVQALEFVVSMDDGKPVSKMFSVVSQKLAGELGPYLVDKRYTRYEFTFIKDAPGTVPPRLVRAVPV